MSPTSLRLLLTFDRASHFLIVCSCTVSSIKAQALRHCLNRLIPHSSSASTLASQCSLPGVFHHFNHNTPSVSACLSRPHSITFCSWLLVCYHHPLSYRRLKRWMAFLALLQSTQSYMFEYRKMLFCSYYTSNIAFHIPIDRI